VQDGVESQVGVVPKVIKLLVVQCYEFAAAVNPVNTVTSVQIKGFSETTYKYGVAHLHVLDVASKVL
jgi:hypothetical protein